MAAEVKQTFNDITKSEKDQRSYRGLELTNGLKVLLVSDPTTDKAAAAMDVHVGSMSDPRQLPGLAHFCEHMLFLGTKEFPDENEYQKFLSQHGGDFNAFTGSDHTNYYFDVSPDHLTGALDRFSQFFISPLFTESATDREVNAVNAEHNNYLSDDTWRFWAVESATCDQSHDFSKFNVGNKLTLDTRPKEEGVIVREALLSFHSQWYSSNMMGLVVLGREDLDTLQTVVTDRFAQVADKAVEVVERKEPPFKDEQLGTITHIVTVKDNRCLNLTWGIPDLTPFHRSCPAHYLTHLLGHEGPGSLFSELRSLGWVNYWLVARHYTSAKGFGFFNIVMDLTEEGIDHVDGIVELVFQYLALLRELGPQEWVFRECQELSRTQFRFKDKEPPQSYVCGLAGDLHDYPLPDVLEGCRVPTEWRPDQITDLLASLSPGRVRVIVEGQRFAEQCHRQEQWYGVKFATNCIKKEILEAWATVPLHARLALPIINDFIPADFSLVERDAAPACHPTVLHMDTTGRLWFKQDDEFLLPKTCISLQLRSPLASLDPHHSNLTSMLTRLFNDQTKEAVYPAELAGLTCSLDATDYGISLSLDGYHEKQGLLLDILMKKLIGFKVEEDRFVTMKEAFTRDLKNFLQSEQPHSHVSHHTSVLLSERLWRYEEQIEALGELTGAALADFVPRLLASLHVECLVYGNCTAPEALQLYTGLVDRLKVECGTRPLLPSQLARKRAVQLCDCLTIHTATNSVHKSSCVQNYYQAGLFDTRLNVLIELFSQIVNESCYTQLRTKEQLGYIVWSGVRRENGAQGFYVQVQGERHPNHLDSRIEAFLASVEDTLEKMEDSQFLTHVEALATKRLEKPKKLRHKNDCYWYEIRTQQYNFDRDNLEVEVLRTVTKLEVLEFYRKYVADSPGRRKLSCHVVSTCEGGAGHPDTARGEQEATEPTEPRVVSDIVAFKASLPLFPLTQPFAQPHQLRRQEDIL